MATDGVIYVNPINTSGCVFGQTTSDLIAFYGKTPIVQRSGSSQAALTESTATSAQICTLVNEMRLCLVASGFMKGD